MKKLLLAAVLACACTLGALADTLGDTTADGTYVYLYNNSNWATPCVWAWTTSENCCSNGTWPGDKMTLVGDGLWKWEAPAGKVPTQIIFSNSGNSQTSDLTYVNKATYNCSGTVLGDNPNPGGGGQDPDPEPYVPGINLITDYYKVNPNRQVGSNRTVNVQVTDGKAVNALNNWTEADLIAQGVARDVCMAFKGTHERPVVDSYALYAAFDANYLYLGCQYVYTVWCEGGENYQGKESKPYNMDGDMMIVFDLVPSKRWDGTLTNGNSVWKDAAYTTFDNGIDCMWHGSTKPGVGTPGLFFPNSSGKADYNDPNSCKTSNVVYGYADGLLPSITAIYGQDDFSYDPKRLEGNEGFIDLTSEVTRMKGDASGHTFYEFKIPLTDLGVSENYIKTCGIGVMMVDMYGASAHATLPYDPSMYDNVFEPYSKDPSTSKEKEDLDVVTYACARIGNMDTSGIEVITPASSEAVVTIASGAISVTGAERVTVCTIDGRVVYTGTGADVTVPVVSGLYVVNADGRATKALVR